MSDNIYKSLEILKKGEGADFLPKKELTEAQRVTVRELEKALTDADPDSPIIPSVVFDNDEFVVWEFWQGNDGFHITFRAKDSLRR